ncbi:C39 family peptidase [Clostridium sporogenes]|uniref:Peptidase C39-like domain-containing protein n=1 Tax=Clostridium botulinum TaxID=1491 RepID=A0A6M0T352_CLOBO|nr:C39 family peptidase [Clostridium sporogenes]NFA62246.1 hypothetical protein [Clostridium botulinum]NFI75335.1 hypothetical protein [Clostridium sporogenes]NFL72441.1 hypothetical protein [Clostridium sporogenes]NFM24993.1 hypothetical protein [Clostridium sporogenes]NFP63379.1 hypothetical protein [Clostridium sporogenes]
MKTKLICGLVALELVCSNTASVFAADSVKNTENDNKTVSSTNFTNEDGYTTEHTTNPKDFPSGITEKDRKAHEYFQQREAELKLINSDSRSLARALGGSKYLKYDKRYSPEKQKHGNWCGPAAALNAIDTRSYHSTGKNTSLTQDILANEVHFKVADFIDQTSFDSKWPAILNKYAPGNNYQLKREPSYSASQWEDVLMQSIVSTIDKGFPVIVDTKQAANTAFLTPAYRNRYNSNGNKPIYHYITVIGYMSHNNGQYFINFMDSAGFNHGVYTVSLRQLAKASYPYGIVY